MSQNIEQGLESDYGREPEDAEQELGSTRSIDDTFNEKGVTRHILESTHEGLTGEVGRAASFLSGSATVFLLGTEVSAYEPGGQISEFIRETTAQYPEASAAVFAGGGTVLLYNAADEVGLLSNIADSLDPDQLNGSTDSKIDQYVELDRLPESNYDSVRVDMDEDKGELPSSTTPDYVSATELIDTEP